MREIKFRAWMLKNAGWMNQWTMVYEPTVDAIGFTELSSINKLFKENETAVTMQYTGLKDKNGKEIYEGDIVLGRFILDDVEDYIFLPLSDKEKKEQTMRFVIEDIFYPYTHPMPDDLEVIGNLYENPELCGRRDK